MTVSCSECGEPIFGNVNRCWRCGNQIQAVADAENKPPVRRRPVVLDNEPKIATAVVSEATEAKVESQKESNLRLNRASSSIDAAKPSYPEAPFRSSLAVSSVVAGAMAFVCCFISRWAIVPALLAFFAAVYGFKSKKKKIAIIGILLSLITIFSISTQTILSIRSYYQQRNNAIYDDAF